MQIITKRKVSSTKQTLRTKIKIRNGKDHSIIEKVQFNRKIIGLHVSNQITSKYVKIKTC